MALTNDEIEMLDREMGNLSRGFRIFREKPFQRAMVLASKMLKKDPAIYQTTAQGRSEVTMPLLVRRVLTDKKQEGYGVPFAWWWIYFEKQLLAGIQSDPWSEVKWWLWLEMRGKREVLTMWGAQNSLKSSWIGRFAVVQMAVWLRHAEIYIAGPYKAHSDDKIWKSLGDWVEHLKNRPNVITLGLGLKFTRQADECFIEDGTGNRGMAKFVALESASAIQGKKAQLHDISGLIGIVMLAVDEFIENPNLEIKQGEGNIGSNANFFGVLPCNPLPEKAQHPLVLPFADPVGIPRASLNRAQHVRWNTKYGVLARFAWMNCPNNLLGRTEWPYMLSKDNFERLNRRGDVEIMDAQIHAWGFGSGAPNAPLDAAAIRIAGTMAKFVEDFTWMGPTTKFIHFDCAFGGRDPATYTELESGLANIRHSTDGNNYDVQRQVFSGVEQNEIYVDADFEVTAEWLSRMRVYLEYTGGSFPQTVGMQPIKAGDKLGGAWHLCSQILETIYSKEIPAMNVSFDASQRGDCIAPLLDCLGRENVRWWYEGSRKLVDEEQIPPAEWYKWPYEYDIIAETGELVPVKWSKHCSQTISMIWFFGCNMIRHGYLVNGATVQRGLDELCARPVVRGRQGQTEGRRDVMGKQALKDAGQASPTWGEGLATALYFGHRFLGLVPIEGPELSTSITPPITPLSIIRAPGMNRRYGAKSDQAMKQEAILASLTPVPYRPLTEVQNAMNRLALDRGATIK